MLQQETRPALKHLRVPKNPGYPLYMNATAMRVAPAVILLGLVVSLVLLPASAESVSVGAQVGAPPPATPVAPELWVPELLDGIVGRIRPISDETRLRRSLAQATFCLPQNVLGILYYAFVQATGGVLRVQEMNEMRVVVTQFPFGVSLGRYIFVPVPLLSERTVRHEYGHAMQGYKHGPFYLLLEGVTSFVQVIAATIFPSLADAYYDRWPENEADDLGGVQ